LWYISSISEIIDGEVRKKTDSLSGDWYEINRDGLTELELSYNENMTGKDRCLVMQVTHVQRVKVLN
jgi:hypothetical protein